MSSVSRFSGSLRSMRRSALDSVQVFLKDTGHGLLEVSHNSLALLGLAFVAGLAFLAGHAELRNGLEIRTFAWLQERHEARLSPQEVLERDLREPDAIERATAADPRELTRQQASVAHWISKRYRVAPEPVSRLVQEAWHVGGRAGLDPTLILAIMAVESSFNPFAQSPVGAQGLMQVMTKVHDDKYSAYGGNHAAFDPVSNVRVGVQVLKECIARAGSLEGGLKFYVGAANMADDTGYASKVLSEQAHLRMVASGRAVPVTAPLSTTVRTSAAQARAESMPAPTGVAQPPAARTPPATDAAHDEYLALLR